MRVQWLQWDGPCVHVLVPLVASTHYFLYLHHRFNSCVVVSKMIINTMASRDGMKVKVYCYVCPYNRSDMDVKDKLRKGLPI